MRIIDTETIKNEVAKICIDANTNLGEDVRSRLESSCLTETNPLAKEILSKIIENAKIAKSENMPICQDTGMAIFFVEIGQNVFVDGNLTDAINEGVRIGYESGYLRKSIVSDPLERRNTGDNTPAVIHYDFVEGDKLTITVAPKGFGSENMSAVKMFNPSDGEDQIVNFILETVKKAGANPCPPIVVGIGIGGSMDKAAILSKLALTKDLNTPNPNEFYNNLETKLLSEINRLDIGPQGFGGSTTALAVKIEPYPTHIAGLPVAITICCHVLRHKTIVL